MGKYLKLFDTHADYQAFTQTSDFIKPNVSHCVNENDVHYNPWTWAEEYLTFVAKEDGTFTFTPRSSNVISYSTDGGETWTEGNSVEVNSGDKVMWKGTMTPREYDGIGKFSSTGNFDVQGNAMSLLYGNKYKGQTDLTGKNFAFYSLFYGNTKVVNAENLSLPATTLAAYCYNNMFSGCASLVTAPKLPATTLASVCYDGMFNGCTSLVNAPELPAETLAGSCYNSMFQGCTSLTTAPVLPATTLANYCYNNMFQGCTSLTTAPVLPATTLTQSCYSSMFSGCINLTTAPELPATTLAKSCYSNMFYNTNIIPDCSNIDFTSETVVSSGGLSGLFGGTKITDADLERILPKNTNGKYCLPVTTLAERCYSNMFQGCTSLTTAPELPATTLTSSCYSNMFRGCTSLTTAPELLATTLTSGCYDNMFYGCTSLNYIKAMFTTTPSSSYTSSWVKSVSATGTFVKNSAATWNVTGNNGIPSGWTVETASA